ncbi:hypothetical protein [Nocardia flavorosea]|nr:hypothetical protein [Nocardia flavorosea]
MVRFYSGPAGRAPPTELHGDFDSYLRAVGITADLRDRLRDRLVV